MDCTDLGDSKSLLAEQQSLAANTTGTTSGNDTGHMSNYTEPASPTSAPSSPTRALQHFPFQPHVDWELVSRTPGILQQPVSPGRSSLRGSFRKGSIGRIRRKSASNYKTSDEVERIVQSGKSRDLKSCLRNHHWLPFDGTRSRLWQVIFRHFIFCNASTC